MIDKKKIREAFKKRESSDSNAAIEAMIDSMDEQEDATLGPFWYDIKKQELFGVVLSQAKDRPYYHSSQYGKDIRTGSGLHKSIWSREYHRGRDKRFSGDYTQVPRGRVFEFKGEGFKVYTGSWIDDYPEAKQEILYTFNLPVEHTEFRKDKHWDIGHGWSDEF